MRSHYLSITPGILSFLFVFQNCSYFNVSLDLFLIFKTLQTSSSLFFSFSFTKKCYVPTTIIKKMNKISRYLHNKVSFLQTLCGPDSQDFHLFSLTVSHSRYVNWFQRPPANSIGTSTRPCSAGEWNYGLCGVVTGAYCWKVFISRNVTSCIHLCSWYPLNKHSV